jgi:hypothetical protein
VKPDEHRPRIAVAPLDGSTPAHEVARGPLRFCTRRPFAARLRRLCSTGKDVSLDGLALDGDRLAFAWSYYGYSAGGPTYRSELYVEDLARTAAPRLVARATGDANGQPRYSAPALGDGTLAALLTCRGGPACTVQPPRVQRIGLSRHSVAEAPLGATTLAASVRAAYAGGLRRGVALGPPG